MASSDFDNAYRQLTDARAANHQAYVAFQQAAQDGETRHASTLQRAELDRQAVVGWADQALRTATQALDEGRLQLLALEINPAHVQAGVPAQREAERARTGLDQALRQANGALAALKQAQQRLLDIRAKNLQRRRWRRRTALMVGRVVVIILLAGGLIYTIASRVSQEGGGPGGGVPPTPLAVDPISATAAEGDNPDEQIATPITTLTDRSLQIGDRVRVVGTEGSSLRARESPSANARIVVRFPEGSELEIIDGPRTADGHIWWRTRLGEDEGWCAAEFLVLVSKQ